MKLERQRISCLAFYVHGYIRLLPDCLTVVSSVDFLCRECFTILQRESINYSAGSVITRAFGHQEVYFACGISILRAKTHRVSLESPEAKVIMSCIPTQQVHRLQKVGLSCWTNAYRCVRRYVQHDQNRQEIIHEEAVTLQGNVEGAATTSSSASETPTSRTESPVPTPPPLPTFQLYSASQNVERNPKITSRIYKCAAATSRHCIFDECQNAERLLIPSVIKEILLLEHKLYIPASARICSYNLNSGSWDELIFNYNDFTGLQMDDMMSIMDRASRRQLDFSNVRGMNPNLCRYWLGVDAEQFHQLLSQVPELAKEVPCPSVALSIMLVKHRTGDTNERLSTLFRLPRSTLERYMSRARNCLGDRFVPSYLGLGRTHLNSRGRNKK